MLLLEKITCSPSVADSLNLISLPALYGSKRKCKRHRIKRRRRRADKYELEFISFFFILYYILGGKAHQTAHIGSTTTITLSENMLHVKQV